MVCLNVSIACRVVSLLVRRVLVFSRFVRMLDVIQRCIEASTSKGGAGFRLSRIDGSHSDLERQSTIKGFNGDESIQVCLVRYGKRGAVCRSSGCFSWRWSARQTHQLFTGGGSVDNTYRDYVVMVARNMRHFGIFFRKVVLYFCVEMKITCGR